MNPKVKKLIRMYHEDPIGYHKQAYDEFIPIIILRKHDDKDYHLTYFYMPETFNTFIIVAMRSNGIPHGVEVKGRPELEFFSLTDIAFHHAEKRIVKDGYLIMYEEENFHWKLNHRRIKKGLHIRGYSEDYSYYTERQEKPVKPVK